MFVRCTMYNVCCKYSPIDNLSPHSYPLPHYLVHDTQPAMDRMDCGSQVLTTPPPQGSWITDQEPSPPFSTPPEYPSPKPTFFMAQCLRKWIK